MAAEGNAEWEEWDGEGGGGGGGTERGEGIENGTDVEGDNKFHEICRLCYTPLIPFFVKRQFVAYTLELLPVATIGFWLFWGLALALKVIRLYCTFVGSFTALKDVEINHQRALINRSFEDGVCNRKRLIDWLLLPLSHWRCGSVSIEGWRLIRFDLLLIEFNSSWIWCEWDLFLALFDSISMLNALNWNSVMWNCISCRCRGISSSAYAPWGKQNGNRMETEWKQNGNRMETEKNNRRRCLPLCDVRHEKEEV